MGSIKALDLVGVIQPICLLKCKKALSELNKGEIMEVYIQDPEVVEDLKKILLESGDEVVDVNKEEDRFRIRIRKGV